MAPCLELRPILARALLNTVNLLLTRSPHPHPGAREESPQSRRGTAVRLCGSTILGRSSFPLKESRQCCTRRKSNSSLRSSNCRTYSFISFGNSIAMNPLHLTPTPVVVVLASNSCEHVEHHGVKRLEHVCRTSHRALPSAMRSVDRAQRPGAAVIAVRAQPHPVLAH